MSVATEPISQRTSVITRIKSLNISRMSLSRRGQQRRQNSLPTDSTVPPVSSVLGREPRKRRKRDNRTSGLPLPNAVHGGNEQDVFPRAPETNQRTAGNDQNAAPPDNADKRIPEHLTVSDTVLHVEQRADSSGQSQCERPAVSKTHVLPDGSRIGAVRNVQRTSTRDKLHRAKTFAFGSIKTAIFRSKRHRSKTEVQIVPTPTTTQSLGSIPACDEPASLQTVQSDVVGSATMVHPEGDQPQSTHAKDAKQSTTLESEEIEKLRQDLSDSRFQVAELQKRCEAQSRDLEGSNSFLNTADKSSDSDVIQILQRLNAEVQQDTTYMADCLAESLEFTDVTTMTKEYTSAVQRASDHLGLALVKSLQMKTSEETPMLLQIAFQAYFASVLGQTISSWAFEPGHNAFIDGIYQRLRLIEAQAISGRWRALARVHTIHNWITHPDSLVKAIVISISDILLAAGCTAPQSKIIETVTTKFEEKIALLVELAGRLNRMFDEVISGDFEAFVVRPGEKFDGKKMEDTDESPVGAQEACALCTTHIGLIKRTPVGTLWERGKKQKLVVLKAKILLETFLDADE